MTTSSNSTGAYGLVKLSGLGRLAESLGQESCALYLEEFVDRLESVLRPADQLVKIATDKYCLVLHGVSDRNHIELAVAKLLREFEPPADIIGDRVFFDLHAGFVVPDSAVTDSKLILQRAESALRMAETMNKPAVVIDNDELKIERADPTLLPRIEQAIEQGEFHLYYQCKVDASFRNVVGAEGLVRWHDQLKQQVVTPNFFIEQVEQSGLIQPLTVQLLRSGISRCASWPAPQSVAVNVSPKLFESAEIVGVVRDALDFFTLAPERLILEVTERGELPTSAFEYLEALRALGAKIAIDDFGTGTCSLSYFRDLPADQIKIDGSFVKTMLTSAKDLAIVRGCIDLAHYCDMDVVAEGVEDEATADQLRDYGCDILQGYAFGKPQIVQEYESEHLAGQGRADAEEDHFSSLMR